MSEYTEQVAIFQWAQLSESKYPQLKYMFSTLNGIRLTIGQARKAKASGNRKGPPDIILPFSNDKYSGLWIELKYGKNKASKEQLEFIEFLKSNGYYAEVITGAAKAIETIKKYLENEL